MKIKVSSLIVAIAIVGIDIGLILGAQRIVIEQGPHTEGRFGVLAYIFCPALSVLALSLISIVSGLVRERKSPAFATGYLFAGTLASFLICLDLAGDSFLYVLFQWIIDTDNRLFALEQEYPLLDQRFSLFGSPFLDLVLIFVFFAIQFGCGLVGGLLARRYGLMIAFSRPAQVPGGLG